MSTPAMVPMLSPDGRSGDIPHDRVNEALAAGFKGAVVMTSPDGQQGYIPHDRAQEAIQAGFKVGQPSANAFADRGQNAEGFMSTLGSDLKGMAKGAITPFPYQIGKQAYGDLKSFLASGKTPAQVAAEQRAAAGHGTAYQVGAMANEALGVNVQGEEQAADVGDVSGVLGHASAVPAAMAATAGVAKGLPPIAKKVGGVAARAGVEAVLQPVGKQFRFGKDPTGFVIDNGITANSLEELHNNIKQVVDDKSTQLDAALKQSPATVNLAPAKKVIANAMQDAMQKRDAATVGKLTELYQRLNSRIVPGQTSIKSTPSPNSVPAWEAAQVKRGIQQSINWAESADKPLNDVKLQVQHAIGEGLHQSVPETAALDESISSGIEAQKAAEKQWLNQQAGRRTVRYGTRVPLIGGAIGGAIGGTPGAAAGATIGRVAVQGLAEPAVGTRLGRLGRLPPAQTPYPR